MAQRRSYRNCSMGGVVLAAVLGLWCDECISAETAWYETALTGMEVGPTGAQFGADPRDTGYAAQFNGADIVAQQVKMGTDYLVIWARDGEYAYYNSKVAPKCPGLGERDPLREAVDAAKPQGLPVVAYCVVQAGGYALRQHPEYRMIGADGKHIERVCLNSSYKEHVKALLAEMLAYGVDGFHVDMLDQGFGPPYGCWCDTCRALFEQQYHAPMPPGVTWDDAWDRMLDFRYATSVRCEEEFRDYIKSINSEASVDFNYHGYPPFSWEVGQRPVQHAHVGDFVTCESGVWGFGALSVGLTAQFTRATAPGEIYQVVMQRGVRFYHDQTTRPLVDLRWEMFSLLANGAQVTIVDKTPFTGVIDPVAYGRMAEVFAEVNRKREHFGQPPVQEVGIYYSSRSRDWYGREDAPKYQQAFFGAHKALAGEHIPYGVLLDENVSAEGLRAFPVVLLCNTQIISPEEVALFRDYVEAGGKLLVTGLSGCYGKTGALQTHSSLSELIGARFVERLSGDDNYVRFSALDAGAAALAADVPQDWPLLMYAPAAVFEATTATAVGELMRPERRWRQRDGLEGTSFPSSPDAVVGPAFLVNQVGKGTVVTLAFSPDAAVAGEYRTVEARTLLRNAVRFVNPDPEVQIEAPRYVDVAVTHDAAAKVYRVHLLGYVAPPGTTGAKRPWVIPEMLEDLPRYTAKIRVREGAGAARSVNEGTSLEVKDGEVSVEVKDVHEVVVISQ